MAPLRYLEYIVPQAVTPLFLRLSQQKKRSYDSRGTILQHCNGQILNSGSAVCHWWRHYHIPEKSGLLSQDYRATVVQQFHDHFTTCPSFTEIKKIVWFFLFLFSFFVIVRPIGRWKRLWGPGIRLGKRKGGVGASPPPRGGLGDEALSLGSICPYYSHPQVISVTLSPPTQNPFPNRLAYTSNRLGYKCDKAYLMLDFPFIFLRPASVYYQRNSFCLSWV